MESVFRVQHVVSLTSWDITTTKRRCLILTGLNSGRRVSVNCDRIVALAPGGYALVAKSHGARGIEYVGVLLGEPDESYLGAYRTKFSDESAKSSMAEPILRHQFVIRTIRSHREQ